MVARPTQSVMIASTRPWMIGLRIVRARRRRAAGKVRLGWDRARLSLNERGLSVPLMLFGSYSWWNSLTAGQHEAHIRVGHQEPLERLTGTILPQAVNLALSLPLYISDL